MGSSDDDLVRAARAGERGAFEALFGRHRGWVVALAWRFTRDRDEAEDVLQETFAYLHRKLPALELAGGFRTFLYPVVKHLALARTEKRRRERPLAAVPEERTAGTAEERLEDLLGGLSEVQQEVVLLRFADGLELQEIAEALQVPLGTVKSRLHSALEILRRRHPNP